MRDLCGSYLFHLKELLSVKPTGGERSLLQGSERETCSEGGRDGESSHRVAWWDVCVVLLALLRRLK